MTTTRLASGSEELEASYRLRHAVFTIGQGVPPEIERDDADDSALHVVAVDGDELLGTGRLVDAGEHARLGRIAVADSAQGRGIGRLVVSELEQQASRLGLSVVRLHAQEQVVGFYERLGYATQGAPDVEAGIRHRWMSKELIPGLRPVADADSEGVIALIGGIWSAYPGVVLDVDREEPWMRAPGSEYAGRGGSFWVVGAEPVACVGVRPTSSGEVELKSLYVRPDQRRARLATRLVWLVERSARTSGASRIGLWSDSRFVEAHAFYERLGYRETDQRRELHDQSDTTELEFEKLLG